MKTLILVLTLATAGFLVGSHPVVACSFSAVGTPYDYVSSDCQQWTSCCNWECQDPNLGPPQRWATCYPDTYDCNYYETMYGHYVC